VLSITASEQSRAGIKRQKAETSKQDIINIIGKTRETLEQFTQRRGLSEETSQYKLFELCVYFLQFFFSVFQIHIISL
jgi:hypothetical protein